MVGAHVKRSTEPPHNMSSHTFSADSIQNIVPSSRACEPFVDTTKADKKGSCSGSTHDVHTPIDISNIDMHQTRDLRVDADKFHREKLSEVNQQEDSLEQPHTCQRGLELIGTHDIQARQQGYSHASVYLSGREQDVKRGESQPKEEHDAEEFQSISEEKKEETQVQRSQKDAEPTHEPHAQSLTHSDPVILVEQEPPYLRHADDALDVSGKESFWARDEDIIVNRGKLLSFQEQEQAALELIPDAKRVNQRESKATSTDTLLQTSQQEPGISRRTKERESSVHETALGTSLSTSALLAQKVVEVPVPKYYPLFPTPHQHRINLPMQGLAVSEQEPRAISASLDASLLGLRASSLILQARTNTSVNQTNASVLRLQGDSSVLQMSERNAKVRLKESVEWSHQHPFGSPPPHKSSVQRPLGTVSSPIFQNYLLPTSDVSSSYHAGHDRSLLQSAMTVSSSLAGASPSTRTMQFPTTTLQRHVPAVEASSSVHAGSTSVHASFSFMNDRNNSTTILAGSSPKTAAHSSRVHTMTHMSSPAPATRAPQGNISESPMSAIGRTSGSGLSPFLSPIRTAGQWTQSQHGTDAALPMQQFTNANDPQCVASTATAASLHQLPYTSSHAISDKKQQTGSSASESQRDPSRDTSETGLTLPAWEDTSMASSFGGNSQVCNIDACFKQF
jgi:hypothetical protein